MSVHPRHTLYNVGHSLTIIASSRPTTQRYAWVDDVTGIIHNASRLVITADMVGVNNFTCIASNLIFGEEISASIEVNFVVMKRMSLLYMCCNTIL